VARFVLQRLALAVFTLLLVSIVIFAVSEVLPGDPGRTVLGPLASPAQVHRIDQTLGVDRPLPVRYGDWVSRFVRGDWGRSYQLGEKVLPLVFNRLGNSLFLGLFAFLLVVPFSIALGVFAALHEGRWQDRLLSIAGLSMLALPEFVIGVLVIVIFAIQLHWLPVSSNVPSWNPLHIVRQLLLPSIPLMFVLFGYISRMARAGTMDALHANYTRTATLKGLPRRTVIVRHVLRNAMLPTITVVSVQVGYLVGGLVVTETLFNYPGIGQLALNAATGHDLPVLEACVLVTALLFSLSNLLADLLYASLNPRIRSNRIG
jgi:peptide/nickel transport system permease protein